MHAHGAEVVETNYLLKRHAAFDEGVALLDQDDPEGPNLGSFEGEITRRDEGPSSIQGIQKTLERWRYMPKVCGMPGKIYLPTTS